MGVYGGIEKNWAALTNTGRTHVATKGVVQSGLVLNLDAGVSSSYGGSGTTWTDLSGNGNTGTLVNGVGYVGTNGGSLTFDGVDDYVDCGNILNFTTGDFSFNVFFFLTSTTTNAAGQGPVLLYKGNYTSSGYYLQLSQTNPASMTFVTNQPGAVQATGSSSLLTVGGWNCISTVRSGSSVKNYINGIDATSGPATHISPASSSNAFRISSYTGGGINIYANIRVSSFQSYNRALSAAEIQQNFLAMRARFGI